jgi:hypothetical protein
VRSICRFVEIAAFCHLEPEGLAARGLAALQHERL